MSTSFFHPSTRITPVWPTFRTADPDDPLYQRIIKWLGENAPGVNHQLLEVQMTGIPGFPEPPFQSMIAFSKLRDFSGNPLVVVYTNNPEDIQEYMEKYMLDREVLLVDYGLTLRADGPSITLMEIQGAFNLPTEWKLMPPLHPAPAPPDPGKPLPPSPAPTEPVSPIGMEVIGSPGIFNGVAGDTRPNGSVYRTADGTLYQKVVQDSPFGSHVWWKRLAV